MDVLLQLLIEDGFIIFLYFYYENRAMRNPVMIFFATYDFLLMSYSAHTSERVNNN